MKLSGHRGGRGQHQRGGITLLGKREMSENQ